MAERAEPDDLEFRVSTFSGGDGACVAVGRLSNGEVVVKHSRAAEPTISFSPTEWAAFLAGVKAGEFDDLPMT